MASVDSQATRSTLLSVDTTLSENINATQNYIPVASTTNFSTSVVAEIETTNEVVSFNDLSENLFRYSQDFTNAVYTKTATVTANATTAPDGTNTGTRVTFSGAFQRVQQSVTTVSGTQYTISLFAKNDSNTNAISVHTNNSPFINIGSFTPGADWLRYSFTFTATITGTTDISIVQDRNSSGFGSIFIWGAQLEEATSTSTYLPTTTSALVGLTGVTRGVNGTTAQAASSGDSIQQLPFAFQSVLTNGSSTLSENIDASQDYIPVASTSGFATGVNATIESTNEVVSFTDLSENQFTFSEEFNNQPSSSRITITTNDTTAPDGTTTADKLIQASGQTNNGFVGNLNFTYLSAVYTFSVFLKNGDNNFASLDFGGGVRGWFNLSNGTIGTTTGLISSSISDEGNGWYRCSTATKSAGNSRAIVYLSNADNTNNGTPGQFIFAWGSQLEQASSPSTYLPTTSSGLVGLTGVTRGLNGTTAASALSGATISQEPSLTFLGIPVRLRGLSVSPDGTGAARLTLCDNNGDSILDIDTPDGKVYTMNMPEDGLVFPNGVFISNTDNVTAYTLFTEKFSGEGLTHGS